MIQEQKPSILIPSVFAKEAKRRNLPIKQLMWEKVETLGNKLSLTKKTPLVDMLEYVKNNYATLKNTPLDI